MASITQELCHALHTSVTPKDYKRLEPHLSGWVHLNEILLLGQLSTDDIRKLIVIETSTKGRRQILTKLTARLKSLELQQLRSLIEQCLNR